MATSGRMLLGTQLSWIWLPSAFSGVNSFISKSVTGKHVYNVARLIPLNGILCWQSFNKGVSRIHTAQTLTPAGLHWKCFKFWGNLRCGLGTESLQIENSGKQTILTISRRNTNHFHLSVMAKKQISVTTMSTHNDESLQGTWIYPSITASYLFCSSIWFARVDFRILRFASKAPRPPLTSVWSLSGARRQHW